MVSNLLKQTYGKQSTPTRHAKSRSACWHTLLSLLLIIAWCSVTSLEAQSTITVDNTNQTSSNTSSVASEAFDPLFVVENLLVRGTGAGSAEARKRAFELAHIAGLRAIVARLTSKTEQENLRLPELEKLTAMVAQINVRDQRLSDTTLVALMDLKFSKEKVKAYLGEEGISFSLTKAKPLLVIPLLQVQGQQLGWDDRSPWFRTWQTKVLPTGLVEFNLPKTEADYDLLLDLIRSGAQNLLQDQIHALGAGALLLVEAKLEENSTGGIDAITVDVMRFAGKSGGQIGQSSLTYRAAVVAGDDFAGIFAKAAEHVASNYNSAWKSQSSTISNRLSELEFEAQIDGLDSWLKLEDQLSKVGLVELVDLRSLSDTQVIARLEFSGSLDQLSAVLGQEGIDLIPSLNRFFLVQPDDL